MSKEKTNNDLSKTSKSNDSHNLFVVRGLQRVQNEKIVKYDRYKLFCTEFNNKNFSEMMHEMQTAKRTDVCEIYINSSGGSTAEGISWIDFLKSQFNEVQTEIVHEAHSMGSLLFCSGDVRIVNLHSQQMMHNYSFGLRGKASDIKTTLNFTDSFLNEFMREVYLKPGFISKKEFKQILLGKEFWFDTLEMLKRGIATHVRENGELVPRKTYLKRLKQKTTP